LLVDSLEPARTSHHSQGATLRSPAINRRARSRNASRNAAGSRSQTPLRPFHGSGHLSTGVVTYICSANSSTNGWPASGMRLDMGRVRTGRGGFGYHFPGVRNMVRSERNISRGHPMEDDLMFGNLPNEFEAASPGSVYPKSGYRIFVDGRIVDRIFPYNVGAIIRVEPLRRYQPRKRR